MNQPVQIRIAEASDARQIMAVINSAFRIAEEFFCFEDRITGLLSVDPSQQQRGLGSRLMTAAEKHCREWGSRFMDIYIVNLRTELFPFYRRRGYVETGTLPFPPEVQTSQPCHFITMAKPL